MTAYHPSPPGDTSVGPGLPKAEAAGAPTTGGGWVTGAGGFDHILLDEPSTADLHAKVAEAWHDFARALAGTLRTLPAGAELEITLDPTASGTGHAVYAVAVSVDDGDRIGARAVGNAGLPEGFQLNRAAIAAMVALGWAPPGVVEGSGDQFGLSTSRAEANQVARVVSRTLRDVYGAPHPAFLVYLARGADEDPVTVEPLGPARPEVVPDEEIERDLEEAMATAAAPEPDDVLALDDRVRTVLSTMLRSDPGQLQVDSDGDISIRAGSAMVFVRVRDNPPLVDVFSPILTDVEPTERLYVKLSELTNRMPIGRLYCTSDTVWASIPVFGRNFQSTHLMLAVQVMTGLADELDDRLHGEFGGTRFFGEGDKSVRREAGEHRTGMYL